MGHIMVRRRGDRYTSDPVSDSTTARCRNFPQRDAAYVRHRTEQREKKADKNPSIGALRNVSNTKNELSSQVSAFC